MIFNNVHIEWLFNSLYIRLMLYWTWVLKIERKSKCNRFADIHYVWWKRKIFWLKNIEKKKASISYDKRTKIVIEIAHLLTFDWTCQNGGEMFRAECMKNEEKWQFHLKIYYVINYLLLFNTKIMNGKRPNILR